MKRIFLLPLVFMPIAFLQAQINVHPVTDGTNLTGKQGMLYALPRTMIRIDLRVQKTENIAGPYAEYAARYLDLKDVNTNDYDEYRITEMKMSPVAVPDPDHVYFAEITDKASKEGKTVLLSLSSSGLIMDLEGNFPDKPMDGLSGVVIQGGGPDDNPFRYYAETNLYEKIDTIIRRVVVDTVTVEKQYLERNWVEKSDEEKAVEAANKITRIREARFNLLTGYQEIPYEADALAYMDDQLLKLEKEYLSLFTGLSFKKQFTYTIVVDPATSEAGTEIPVFVFSERSGIKEAGASGGNKVNMVIEPLGDFGTLRSISGERNKSEGEKGFYYRIPVMARIKLNLSRDLIVQEVFPLCQLGSVSFLPPNVTSVQFHPETGSVKTLLVD